MKNSVSDLKCMQRLQGKINGQPVDDTDIVTQDLFGEYEPWVVFGERPEKELYFFTPVKPKHTGGKSIKRTAGSGSWKGDTVGSRVALNGEKVGERKTFTFACNGSEYKDGERWTMYEYRMLIDPEKNVLSETALCKVKRSHESECSRKKRKKVSPKEENKDDGEQKGPKLLIPKAEQEVNKSNEDSLNKQELNLEPEKDLLECDLAEFAGELEKDLLDETGVADFAGELLKGRKLCTDEEEEEILMPNPVFDDKWTIGCELLNPPTYDT